MTASNLRNVNQVLEIDLVEDVVVTDIVDDGTGSGAWIRSIRIFGNPVIDGGAPVFEMRIRSATKSKLEMTAPTQSF